MQKNTINQLELVNLLLQNRGLYSLLKQIFKSAPVNGHCHNNATTLKFQGELKERLYTSHLPQSIQVDKKLNPKKKHLSLTTVKICGRNTAQIEAAYNEARSKYATKHQEQDLAKKEAATV